MLKKFKEKPKQITKPLENQPRQQDVAEDVKEIESSFFRVDREFKAYSDALDKIAITLMEIKRELVRQEQAMCEKYQKIAMEKDLATESNLRLIKRILLLKNDLQGNAQKLSEKPLDEVLQLLQADLFGIVDKEKVTKIPVTIGAIYDPLTFEAVPGPINNEVPEGTIVREILPGYFCGSKKILSAKVEVTKKGEVAKQ
ncbi:MAG: nucleotide exchange factor GrpE [Candidatus Bathyarchaeota archaeon]|nr:nucleotide exchange factor GrpE [Candidatus Bathyarchaeota archaeon]